MRRPAQRARPLEYTLLYAVTLFLLAIGAVMVYSARSARSLLLAQPDMGTALVICFAMGALLIAADVPKENLLKIVGILAILALIFAVAEPYRRARLLTFLHPWHDQTGAGFQSVQAMIAIGSGGFFGVGLGESVQKIFYLPEAHTDMILAVIGEEWGVLGIGAVAGLFGLLGYAGLRAAKAAKDRYAKLVAAGITGLILSQATLNLFAVMGMAPLTGVPLPFISYGSSNLIVVLAGAGILLNVAGGPSVSVRERKPRPQRKSTQQSRPRRARSARAA